MRAPFCTEKCRTQNHRVNADFCAPCTEEHEAKAQLPFGLENPDQLLQPFCACGHVISKCDHSRPGCAGGGGR